MTVTDTGCLWSHARDIPALLTEGVFQIEQMENGASRSIPERVDVLLVGDGDRQSKAKIVPGLGVQVFYMHD